MQLIVNNIALFAKGILYVYLFFFYLSPYTYQMDVTEHVNLKLNVNRMNKIYFTNR